MEIRGHFSSTVKRSQKFRREYSTFVKGDSICCGVLSSSDSAVCLSFLLGRTRFKTSERASERGGGSKMGERKNLSSAIAEVQF